MNKKQRMYERIEQHGQNLKKVFHLVDVDPVELCKKVRRIEMKAHKLAEDYCNGQTEFDEWQEKKENEFLKSLNRILNFTKQGIPVIINGDPRGYALKIDDGYMREHNLEIYRDWGGYGIIAPEFDGRA